MIAEDWSHAALAAQLCLTTAAFAHAWADLLLAPRLPKEPRLGDEAPRLSVIVPARDEAENIGACLASLVAQRYPDLEILVVDDRSTDATATIVAAYASQDTRVRLLSGRERPAGWQGKSWAIHQGVGAATGAFFAMVDADVTLSPLALARMVALARERGAAMVSLLPRLRDVSFWEKVIQPVIGLFLFLCQPLWMARAPRSRVAVANGQLLLLERARYEQAGGHEAVRSAIVEDVELARRYKKLGLRLLLVPAFEDAEVRMYRGLGGIWAGWGKTIHPYVAARPIALWLAILPLLWLFLSPFVAPLTWVVAPHSAFAWAQAACASLILVNALAFRRVSHHELTHGLLWPLAIVVLAALFLTRTAGALGGRGVVWKGRRYG